MQLPRAKCGTAVFFAAGLLAPLKQAVVGAASGQITGDVLDGLVSPAFQGLAVVDPALNEGTGVVIGDLCE
jgi:hypothetical protein